MVYTRERLGCDLCAVTCDKHDCGLQTGEARGLWSCETCLLRAAVRHGAVYRTARGLFPRVGSPGVSLNPVRVTVH